jgi:cysteinyl-tRNA synthetase
MSTPESADRSVVLPAAVEIYDFTQVTVEGENAWATETGDELKARWIMPGDVQLGSDGKPHHPDHPALLLEPVIEKMSKSRGNFYTVRDVLDGKATGARVHPAVLRYELTKSNYRKNMNFTAQGLQDSATAVRRLNDFVSKLEEETGGEAAEVDNTHPVLEEFFASMADDLNVAGALGALLPWASVSRIPDNPHEALAVMRKINQVLAVAPLEAQDGGAGEGAESSGAGDEEGAVAGWCRELDAARADKDYEAADRLRDQIIEAGYDVSTSPEGTIAKKRLA